MEFFGKAITREKRKELLDCAKNSGANECCIGFMKTENDKYISVARFFKNDKLLFYVVL